MATAMVMVSMAIRKSGRKLHKIVVNSCVLTLSYGLFFSHKAAAFDWRMRPSLSMSEVFTDNLELSDTAKRSGFITEVAPGVSLFGTSPWSNFNLNYRLQGLYNAGGSDAVDINHQLQMNGLYQAVRNRLFVQTSSSISQQNISNGFIATDNLTGGRDRTETKNFSISPYWTPQFGQYARGLFKVGYQNTSFDNASFGGGSVSSSGLISDSDTFSKQARLTSGTKFGRVRWSLNYSSQEQSRATGDDILFEQYQGDLRYYLNRKFNVFGQAGYENNDYQTLNDSINNGFFYTFGGQWSPNRWYSLEAGYGNNRHVTVRFNPSPNFIGHVTYRNKEVGLNTGDSWDANIRYRAQQAFIGFNYSQDTTTVQQVLVEQTAFDLTGPVIDTDIDPVTGQPLSPLLNPNLPNFVDDVIVNKQASLTFGYQTGKSSYNLSFYNTRRTYELNPQEDNVYGASGSWNWRLAPRLNFYLRPTWQTIDNEASSNDRYDVALGFSKAIPINLGRPLLMNTRLEFRHINQMSDLSTNDYVENRATANFAVRF